MDAIDFLYREKVVVMKQLHHAKTVKNDRDRVMYHERINYLNVLIARARNDIREERHAS